MGLYIVLAHYPPLQPKDAKEEEEEEEEKEKVVEEEVELDKDLDKEDDKDKNIELVDPTIKREPYKPLEEKEGF